MTQDSTPNQTEASSDNLEEVVSTEELLPLQEGEMEAAQEAQAALNLQAALTAAEENAKAMQDKYLRLHAEFDNYRRRTAREQFERIEAANGKLLE